MSKIKSVKIFSYSIILLLFSTFYVISALFGEFEVNQNIFFLCLGLIPFCIFILIASSGLFDENPERARIREAKKLEARKRAMKRTPDKIVTQKEDQSIIASKTQLSKDIYKFDK